MNSADADADTSRVAVRLNAFPSASGWLSPQAWKPSMGATMRARHSAISMTRIEATRLTTAFDDRSELRNSRHLSQIKVSSWDIDNDPERLRRTRFQSRRSRRLPVARCAWNAGRRFGCYSTLEHL